jgi:4-hydroxythreonine-4-phosphate dehydrogenase
LSRLSAAPRPRVAVTLGDPRGIGPEVARRAIEHLVARPDDAIDVSVVLPSGAVADRQVEAEIERYAATRGSMSDADAGRAAARSIEVAVEAALRGDFQAVVTGPLHKPSLHAAGWDVPGQTEMLGQLTRSRSVGMLMAAESTRLGAPLRVLLATTHLPLRDVPDAVTTELLVTQTLLLDHALRGDWRIAAPRLGLCALNPHASDGGLFGSEEALVFEPAAARLRALGVHVSGPLPADTVFARALEGELDAVVAPYHDVGMAAFKTVSFGSGVNVTLGLPFVRTSPDHGTAFDIAGTDRADASSMLEAIQLGARLANARFDMGGGHV